MPSTYEPIATTTLGSAASSVTFSSIPSTYTDLVMVIAGSTVSGDGYLQFNGDTSSFYSSTRLYGDGSGAYSDRISSFGVTIGGFTNAVSIINIFNYANTTTFKTSIARINNPAGFVDATVNLWRKTPEAITQIVASAASNWASGCSFTLYGIKAA
jgi:hypothetical protein